MNYQNLENEMKEYSTYFKYCDSVLSKIFLFFREFSKSGSKFVLSAKKSIEDIYTEINKESYFSSSLTKNLNYFCDDFNEIMDKLQSLFTRIDTDIVNKIIEFDKDYKSNSRNYLSKLNDLNNSLAENKNKLEKIKNNYFDSCKSMSDYDKKYASNKQKENLKKEGIEKMGDQLEKLKQISETKKVYYRIEVTKINDLLLNSEKSYSEIINLIEKEEEERGQFYVRIILLFINGIKELNFENKEYISRNEKYIDDIFIKRDIKMFSIFFNHFDDKTRTRFLKEEFLDFDNSQNKTESDNTINEINEINENPKSINIDNDIKEIGKIDYRIALRMINLGKEPLIDIDTMDSDFIEIDSIIFNLIQRDEKIDDEKFISIINFIGEKIDGCKNFLYLLMGHYYVKNLVKFNNLENLQLLNSIMNIIINYIIDNDDYIYLCFLMLYIGQKTVFYTKDEKYPTNYLCKLMSKSTIYYHTIEFWQKIITLKIKMLAKIKINEEFQYKKKNNLSKDTGLISGLGKLFGGKNEANEKIENEILYSQIYKENISFYCNEILSEYLYHFMDYDFIEEKTFELIDQISNQYNLNVKQKNYYIEILNSNKMYKKAGNPYITDYENRLKKCTQLEYDKIYLSFNPSKKFGYIGNNSKIKILLFSMKYLNKDDIISILCLNKECYNKMKKIVYKNILIKYNKNIDRKKHVNIWKILLNYNSTKQKYNYKDILDSINKSQKKESIFDIIELDVIRTSFVNNRKENHEKLGNILKVTSKVLPTVNYCQGMNHIASFLLIVCDEKEEETFYLFLSILLSTDYCSLVVNDLLKLNSFFYSFERLLNIMFPEMYNYLMSHSITCDYFCSSWFITLYTIAFANVKEKNLEVMINIFDQFLLSGWKTVFKIGISLLRINSIKIFSLPYDQLVHYLNNAIIGSDFFQNDNFNELMNISINFKLSNNLVNNLCKEFEMKESIINKNK